MNIGELCTELNNFFVGEKYSGEFTVDNGILAVDFLLENQYFRVVNSTFNNGVYKYGTDKLIDETFSGEVWTLKIPPDVISLLDDITVWLDKYGAAADSPYSSESFGGYSNSKFTGSNGGAITWRDKFAGALNRYRKV